MGERQGERQERTQLGVCVFVLLEAQGPLSVAHCAILGSPWKMHVFHCWRTRSLRWKNSPPLPFVGPIMTWHNSSKILWLVDHWIWRYLARSSGPRRRQWSLGSDARLLNQANLFLFREERERKRDTERERREKRRGSQKYDIFPTRCATCLWNFIRFSRTMATLVRDARQNVFDDDEVGRAEQQKRGGNMPVYNTRLLLFSLKITFVICNFEFQWFLSGNEPLGSTRKWLS